MAPDNIVIADSERSVARYASLADLGTICTDWLRRSSLAALSKVVWLLSKLVSDWLSRTTPCSSFALNRIVTDFFNSTSLVCATGHVELCGNGCGSTASPSVLSILEWSWSWSTAWELAAQLQFGYGADLLGELRLSAASKSLLHLGQITAKRVVSSPIHIGHLCECRI